MSIALVILAAGIGSRYGGLKQVEPVGPNGEIVIDYAVFDALRAGFKKVVCVIRRDIEKDFRACIANRFERQIDVEYVFQELDDLPAGFVPPADRKKPWGTGHAIRACRDAVREPFGVINADDFYGPRSFSLLADLLRRSRPDRADFSMVGFVLRNTLTEHGSVARGICRLDAAGMLADVVERTAIFQDGDGARCAGDDGQTIRFSGDELVSMNMWGFTPALFGLLDRDFADFLARRGGEPKAEFFIPTVVDAAIRARNATVKVVRTPERWFGVTYPQDKPLVVAGIRALIEGGQYPDRLWK